MMTMMKTTKGWMKKDGGEGGSFGDGDVGSVVVARVWVVALILRPRSLYYGELCLPLVLWWMFE